MQLQLDKNELRCLGHAHNTPKEWCARVHDCLRHAQILREPAGVNAVIRPRLCKSQEFENFIAARPAILDDADGEGDEM